VSKLGTFAVSISTLLAGCASDGMDGMDGASGAMGDPGDKGDTGDQGPPGPQLAAPAVYTLTNAVAGNQVASYVRAETGSISRAGKFDTMGTGTGGGLGSQGALVFDDETGRFFAVNAGDDTVSMLVLGSDGSLQELAKVASGGKRPVSVAARSGVVYVANQGDTTAAAVGANIAGFAIDGDKLMPIASSVRSLSATTDVHPTDITLSPDGKFVVVAERLANKLDVFALDGSSAAQVGSFQASAGMQPFAFDWSPEGFLVVAEVGDGSATGSSASSYSLGATGTLTPITSVLATHQGAACWIQTAGGHAYVANAASGTITGLAVSETGALTLLDQSGVTAVTGAGAIDLAVTPDRGYLYSLANGAHTISVFAINADGSLTGRPSFLEPPASAAGLVAR